MSRLPLTLAGRMAAVTASRSVVRLALDRSVRSYDQDGRLRVAAALITKACVSPYLGSEIDAPGLDPSRTYQMLRPVEELRKALASFNGLPILTEHVPVNASDHQPDLTVGATGTDARLSGTDVTNSLTVWAAEGISLIESGRARSLSLGYRYTPRMERGSFMGTSFDGIMENIEGNHLALVPEPRVLGAMVGDAAPTFIKDNDLDLDISKLMTFLGDKLSQEDLIAVGKMLAGNDDDGSMAGDDPPPFKGRPETGGTMTGDARRRAAADFDARYPNRSRSRGTV
jgi:hypothetical protein